MAMKREKRQQLPTRSSILSYGNSPKTSLPVFQDGFVVVVVVVNIGLLLLLLRLRTPALSTRKKPLQAPEQDRTRSRSLMRLGAANATPTMALQGALFERPLLIGRRSSLIASPFIARAMTSYAEHVHFL